MHFHLGVEDEQRVPSQGAGVDECRTTRKVSIAMSQGAIDQFREGVFRWPQDHDVI
jgi:hypothetical protein